MQVRRVFDVDEMELHVLPRRDVQYAVRVLLGAVGEHLELLSGQPTERNLDALHAGRVPLCLRAFQQPAMGVRDFLCLRAVVTLAIVVALAVDTTPQAELGEDFLLELALFTQLDLALESVDFFGDVGRDLRRKGVLPVGHVIGGWAARRRGGSTGKANGEVVSYGVISCAG